MDLFVYLCLWPSPSGFLQDLAGPQRQKSILMVSIDRKVGALSRFATTGDDKDYRQVLAHVQVVRKQDERRLEAKIHTIKSFEYVVRRQLEQGVRNPDRFESDVSTLQSARRWSLVYRRIVQAKVREETALEAVFYLIKLAREFQKPAPTR